MRASLCTLALAIGLLAPARAQDEVGAVWSILGEVRADDAASCRRAVTALVELGRSNSRPLIDVLWGALPPELLARVAEGGDEVSLRPATPLEEEILRIALGRMPAEALSTATAEAAERITLATLAADAGFGLLAVGQLLIESV